MSIIDYLVLPKGARRKKKLLGRGGASGHGKTSGHGHKGQQARGKTKASKGFEGGQMPLMRRIPKRGFNNQIFSKTYQVVNLLSLDQLAADSDITPALMKENGLIRKPLKPVKVLGKGKITKKMTIHAHAFSKTAKEAIAKAGGKALVIKDRG